MVLAPNETPETLGATHAHGLLGPYENWMMDVGKYYDLPGLMLDKGVILSCIAEFEKAIDYEKFQTERSFELGRWSLTVMLPTLHKNKGFRARFIPFLLMPTGGAQASTQLLSRNAQGLSALFEEIASKLSSGNAREVRIRLNFPIRNETLNSRFVQTDPASADPDPALNGEPPKVIVAIIDMGVPFANARFRHHNTTNTRIDYCWAQSAPADATASADVLFGREFTRQQIDTLVTEHGGDEDAIYAQAGLLSEPGAPPMPLSRMHSHGAHVLDTLAGNWDPATEAEVRIIAVDLPASSVWETSGFGKDMFVVSALHYIFERASRIKDAYGVEHLPLVINLSYGYSGGPHDGKGLIEDAMAELMLERNASPFEGIPAPTAIVMPSGNMFQDRLYAQITDAHFQSAANGDKVATLQWFAPPCDRTSSYLEIWYPAGTLLQDIRIEVTPPHRDPFPEFRAAPEADYFATNLKLDGAVIGQFSIEQSRKFLPDARLRATIITAPTEAPAGADFKEEPGQTHAPSPAGQWQLRFILTQGVVLDHLGIECRIQRDTSYGQGNTGAQQGYFIDPNNPRYDEMGRLSTSDSSAVNAKVCRFGSMNGMATARSTLVVGGHVISTERATVYSGAGVTRLRTTTPDTHAKTGDGGARSVDISAPAERSPCQPGIIAAGTRSGLSVAFQGTSSSAPQVARQLATLLMEKSGFTVPEFLDLLAADTQVKPVEQADDSPAGKRRLGGYLLANR